FKRDQRRVMADVFGERLVQGSGFLFQNAGRDRNASLAETCESLAADQGVGVGHAGHYAANTSGNHGIGARTSSALVRAGLEVDVERRAPSSFSGLFEGPDFSVLQS